MNLDDRIICALGRRKEMEDRIKEWEQPRPSMRLHYALASAAAAACLVLILWVLPKSNDSSLDTWDSLGLEQPTLVDYRAGNSSAATIQHCVERKEYDDALRMINVEIDLSQKEIELLSQNKDEMDDFVLYEVGVLNDYVCQLQWLQIYALVKQKKDREATVALRSYVLLKTEHQQSAELLLKSLTNQ